MDNRVGNGWSAEYVDKMEKELNKTILGTEVEVLERIEQHGPFPGHWYQIRFVEADKIRIAPAKYLEDEFWK